MNRCVKIAALMTIPLAVLDVVLITLVATDQFPCGGDVDKCTVTILWPSANVLVKTNRGNYVCSYNPLPPNNSTIGCYFYDAGGCPSFACNRSGYIALTIFVGIAAILCGAAAAYWSHVAWLQRNVYEHLKNENQAPVITTTQE